MRCQSGLKVVFFPFGIAYWFTPQLNSCSQSLLQVVLWGEGAMHMLPGIKSWILGVQSMFSNPLSSLPCSDVKILPFPLFRNSLVGALSF